MLWLLLFVVLAWAACAFLEKALAVLTAVVRDRDHRRALESLYQHQALNELQAISRAINGPPQAPLSKRIAEASRDVKRRRQVSRAIQEELGVR